VDIKNNAIDSFFFQYVIKNYRNSEYTAYKSWIPTNLGQISFKYIANELYSDYSRKSVVKNYKTKEVTYIDTKPQISDQLSLNIKDVYKFLPKQEKPIIFIDLKYDEVEDSYCGNVNVFYLNKKRFNYIQQEVKTLNQEILSYYNPSVNIEENNILQYHKESLQGIKEYLQWKDDMSALVQENSILYMKSNFKIELNGTVHLNNIETNALSFNTKFYIENSSDAEKDIFYDLGISFVDSVSYENTITRDKRTIALVLYTAVKRIIHTDNHHHSKLDTMIPVVEEHKYSVSKTLSSMSNRIKDIETILRKHMKEPERGFSSNADGVYAYMKSFAIINNVETSKEIKLASSVISSIKAINERMPKFKSCLEYFSDTFKVYITLLISLLILTTALQQLFIKANGIYFVIIISSLIIYITIFLFSNNCPYRWLIKYMGNERFYIVRRSHKVSYLVMGTIVSIALIALGYFL